MMQRLQYELGNVLAYAEYGDPNGYPILVQHGMVASINDAHLFDRLIQSGLRLVCIARPGYGESSPYCMRDMAEWGEIVSVLVDALKMTRFDVLGMSSGAPYSYAIGAKMPDRIRNIFIFSGIPALYDERVLALWPYPSNRQASLDELKKVAKEVFFSDVSPEELQRDDVRDSMANDCFGIAQDLKLRVLDWGFTLQEIKAAVFIQHSRMDNLEMTEITAGLMPNCRLEIRESGGHFSAELLDDFMRDTMIGHYERGKG